ncbi:MULTISPECIES: alpha/beta hydrolase [Streptomyces]|uniref:alpha/beta hydrolase n=1 Tax=Streptomyces TaxID=1883 RepID=UPI000BD6BE52|nr:MULTISPECIES: alpha/beta hydrolase [Streptomyces]MDX2553714.1 alpha/beta hydrolase [Streptomyces stelliscabiei]MDX2613310.1 alpha/beta hydrolase [Streptomyces stelliscabiei]MDX2641457.1 alpha/beta hydrolase [Streptomyces stelliscabiei]MDX2664498.1 alpha/beta hydrolase [Streptomyces stelliscabiei]MDX2713393.1 alpha/beta hydrolase [Streptomyces stelliscabiei]
MRTDDGRYGPPDAGLRALTSVRLGDPQREEADWEGRSLNAGTHSIPVRVYRPGPNPYGWLVWAHGGSWQAGSVEYWHEPVMDLARVSGCTVVSTGYRLAPRHRHPAQLDDVLTALSWAGEQAEPGEPVAVGGDSAGGTIAACAALARRDRGEPLAAQVLAYPPLDPDCAAPSYTREPGAFPSAEDLRRAWRGYRGASGTAVRDGERLHSTPLEAVRLDGLAPAILAVGDLDPVADDVTGYARRLEGAGNDVRLRVFPHTPHAVFLAADRSGPHDPPLRHWLGTALRERLRPRKETA